MDPESNSSMLIRSASEGNYEELCEILNSWHFDKNSINQALYQAVSKSQSASDHLRCIETLLGHNGNPNFKDANGVSLLMIAAKLGQIQLAELLINGGSQVEDKDKENRTPLMYAVESCYGDNVDVVKFLLEKKAKVSCQDNHGNSALHRSADRGYADSMQVLLDFGAFINAENKEKDTPLHLACKSSYESCVELLINRKANIHLANAQGKTPAELAPEQIKLMFETPQDNNSDSSFCSMSSHNEISCKICKKNMNEAICKACHEINLQYNIQTFNDSRKQIEEHAKEIGELKNSNVELSKHLKIQSENCKRLKEIICEKDGEIKKKEAEVVVLSRELKEEMKKKMEENKELLNKIKEFEDEIESLKEQIINLKSDVKFHRNDSDILRKRLEEWQQKESDGVYMIRRAQKKVSLTYLKPYSLPEKSNQSSVLKEEISAFMQEIEKWQEEVDPIYVELTSKIRRVIKKRFQNGSIEIYGSYATRLHLPSSDIDMVITGVEGDKRDTLRILEKLLKSQSFVRSTNFIQQALIPIIKIKSELLGKMVQIDITVSDTNHSGLKCLGVVNRLMTQSSMIRPVFLILKELLYVCSFKEPYTGGLGSYSLFLMVVSFIQKRLEMFEKSKAEQYTVSDCLIEILGHYANHNAYFTPIITHDPGNNHNLFINDRETFDNYVSLIVVDPLNSLNNVAFSTNLDKLTRIFNNACYNLKRLNLCDCTLSASPLYRMIYETKEYVGS